MTLDPRLRVLLAQVPSQQEDREEVPAIRRVARAAAASKYRHRLTSDGPPLAEIRDECLFTESGPVAVRVYRPSRATLPCVLYIHGGGWWTGSARESDGTCARLAAAARCVVVSVDYRLAPEHPYPAALYDCYGVATYVSGHAESLGADGRLVLVGRSSGANLAASVALLARDENRPSILGQVLDAPLLDCTMSHPSVDQFSAGYMLTRDDIEEAIVYYLHSSDPRDPLASPIFARLRGVAPALVITAEYDPLRDEGAAYAARLAQADVPVIHHEIPGITHASADFDVLMPDVAADYMQMVATFVQSVFDRTPCPAVRE